MSQVIATRGWDFWPSTLAEVNERMASEPDLDAIGFDAVTQCYITAKGVLLPVVPPFAPGLQKALVITSENQIMQFALAEHPEYLTDQLVFAIIDGVAVSLGIADYVTE